VTTDIVILTCGRQRLFRRTLEHIQSRTSTPYRLCVMDDNSGYTAYLEDLLRDGKIGSLVSRSERMGIAANLRTLQDVTTSDPIVYVDDDILCPKLDPDWLECGLTEMANRPQLGLLALNNPQANIGDRRHIIQRGAVVTTCRNVGGTFLFIRRSLLGKIGPSVKYRHSIKAMCLAAARQGYDVGYLAQVYCQHIGAVSVREKSRSYEDELREVYPINSDTLEAPDGYKD